MWGRREADGWKLEGGRKLLAGGRGLFQKLAEASCQKQFSVMQIRGGDGQWTPGQIEGRTINTTTPEGPIYSVFLLAAVSMFMRWDIFGGGDIVALMS